MIIAKSNTDVSSRWLHLLHLDHHIITTLMKWLKGLRKNVVIENEVGF